MRIRERFNPRAPCGARPMQFYERLKELRISTHAPLAGRDPLCMRRFRLGRISTHAPLAGRDAVDVYHMINILYFNPRAPCGARPKTA